MLFSAIMILWLWETLNRHFLTTYVPLDACSSGHREEFGQNAYVEALGARTSTRRSMSEMGPLSDVGRYFVNFESQYQRQNFGAACDAFAEAIRANPEAAFRHFMTRASGPLARCICVTCRAAEFVPLLDGLLADFPNMHLLADDDPAQIRRLVELREANISKGLPSMVVVTQGKSASVPVANIFNSGFSLPSFAYSISSLVVIESFARDYARGGACYSTHLDPTAVNIQRFKAAGIDKIIVHVRDPRQSLLSMLHHVVRYPNETPELARSKFHERSVGERIDQMLSFFFSRLNWIQGWIDAESELNVMFSTFEGFVRDRPAFTRRYLEFYGGHEEHFSWENAMNAGGDHHFRAGRLDEWREVFPSKRAEFLTAVIPTTMRDRFGWAA
jgi:hypothetical protein